MLNELRFLMMKLTVYLPHAIPLSIKPCTSLTSCVILMMTADETSPSVKIVISLLFLGALEDLKMPVLDV